MRILSRLIRRAVWRGLALVFVVLVPLFSLGDFVRELDDIGRGRYAFIDVVRYVALTTPERAIDLASVCGLLGTLLGLGSLAGRNELLAMRALGVSVGRLAWAVARAGLPFVVLVAALVEFVAPPLTQRARELRSSAMAEAPSDGDDADGMWLRDGDRIVRVERLEDARVPRGVEVLEFDDEGRLARKLRAERARISAGTWMLEEVDIHEVGVGAVRHERRLAVPVALRRSELDRLLRLPESLSPTDLVRQIADRKKRGRSSRRDELLLWQKIARPLATLAMILLAVPFAFGRLRASGLGRRLALGSVLGLAFYLLTEISGYLGIIYSVDPILCALAPVALVLVPALVLLRFVR